MNRSRKTLAALLVAISLLGVGAVVQPSGAAASQPVPADRWCC